MELPRSRLGLEKMSFSHLRIALLSAFVAVCAATATAPVCSLRLRGGYDDAGGYGGGGDGGGGYSRGGGYGGRGGGFRGRGRGFRGRGRGAPRAAPDGPIDELKLYVGGLSWDVDSNGLKDTFAQYGDCTAEVMLDKWSGRSRGFGFVTFTDANAASAAMAALDGQEIMGRVVAINNARQRTERPEGDTGGGGGDEAAME